MTNLQERLAQAQARVAKGARRVERQRRIVAELERHNHERSAAVAKSLLAHLESL